MQLPTSAMTGVRDIVMTCPIEGYMDCIITLQNVAFSPNAWDNLISESHMDKKGLEVHKFNVFVSILKPDGKMVMQGIHCGGLFEINCQVTQPSSLPSDIAFSVQYKKSLDL